MAHRNPSSRLPNLRREPTLADVEVALSYLANIYAPSLLDEEARAQSRLATELTVEDIELVRCDEHERRFAKSWLVRLIASSASWLPSDDAPSGGPDDDLTAEELVEFASRILAAEATVEDSGDLARTFTFPLARQQQGALSPHAHLSFPIVIHLRDASLPASGQSTPASGSRTPLRNSRLSAKPDPVQLARAVAASKEAAEAVGVQTWGSAVIFSDEMIKNPEQIHARLGPNADLSVIELGAGTGLVGMTAAKLTAVPDVPGRGVRISTSQVLLTDYHDRVLANLAHNVKLNFKDGSEENHGPTIEVQRLDWERIYKLRSEEASAWDKTLEAMRSSYSLVLAADVIYSPTHAAWLYACIEHLLARPDKDPDARAHIFIPLRTSGKFAAWRLVESADEAFGEEVPPSRNSQSPTTGPGYRLAVILRQKLQHVKGIGRHDEALGYLWWTFAFLPDSETQSSKGE